MLGNIKRTRILEHLMGFCCPLMLSQSHIFLILGVKNVTVWLVCHIFYWNLIDFCLAFKVWLLSQCHNFTLCDCDKSVTCSFFKFDLIMVCFLVTKMSHFRSIFHWLFPELTRDQQCWQFYQCPFCPHHQYWDSFQYIQ